MSNNSTIPKKPSIFSVSSLLSNDSPSSKTTSTNSALQSNKSDSGQSEIREKDEITSEILPNMRSFLYPGLTLGMLTKNNTGAPPDLFPRNLTNPFAATFGSLFPGRK